MGEHEGIGFLPNNDWLLDLELNGEYRLARRRKIWGKQQKVQRLKREYSALSSIRQNFFENSTACFPPARQWVNKQKSKKQKIPVMEQIYFMLFSYC